MAEAQFVVVGSFGAPMKLFRIEASGVFQYISDVGSSGPSPTYIVQSRCKRYVYCTCETEDAASSEVLAFFLEEGCHPTPPKLRLLSRLPSEGAAPCHLSIDDDSTHLIVSNYFSGNVVVFPLSEGALLPPCQTVSFGGPATVNGVPRPQCRGGPHSHQTVHHPSSGGVLLCELGQNAVYTYKYDRTEGPRGEQVLSEVGRWDAPEGFGPRHLVLHPSGNYAYVVFEEANAVAVLSVDAKGRVAALDGCAMAQSPQSLQSPPPQASQSQGTLLSTLRVGEDAGMNAAEVLLSPDARFLYVSNRDVAPPAPVQKETADVTEDTAGTAGTGVGTAGVETAGTGTELASRCSIAVFEILRDGRLLRRIQLTPSLGRHPRGITLLPGSKGQPARLAVANKDPSLGSGCNVVVFDIDPVTGCLLAACVTQSPSVPLESPSWIHLLHTY
ncbi:Lactonase, 7-bladed beta-propeller-domain-containing protein [Ochromonadaceae sp. CCMP2298]|nr:Lactonase, 7-bladed beta-propeller-domain-containing protein [Ochromonadaceae sp. CCMP2298]|mmetsp:Transcript_10054/g.22336  ORF Transcript_10054/g.22336 Transcript_10054/m.22336 type:complete len:443 (-) Transcript_10054:32-1360(-)